MPITGVPFAQVGVAGADYCPTRESTIRGPCVECRQVDRWMERTVAWADGQYTRFKNIVRATLTSHDDVLRSLCGFCAGQNVIDCACFTQQYITLGLPLVIDITPPNDPCLVITAKVDLDATCYTECLPDCVPCLRIIGPLDGTPTCWDVDCATLCADCETVTLDPCNNPTHLDMMGRTLAAVKLRHTMRATGPNITAILGTLFPGSIPQIVGAKFGRVYVTLGRALTPEERSFLAYLKSVIPLALGVELDFVTPCP